ncbi:MAG: type II secretion system F family protein [Actinomycetota bacterium]
MDSSWIGVLLAFGAVLFALVALQDFVLERRQVFKALRSVRAIELTPTDIRQKELAVPFLQRVLIPSIRGVGSFGRKFTPSSVTERLGKELIYAGTPVGWDAERVLAMKILGVAIFAIGALVFGKLVGWTPFRTLVAAGLGAYVGYYIPEWVLRSKSGKRQFKIQRALPDALDLLSITVEAGLGFDAAMARVARQSGGPLGEEMHRVLQEMQIGKTRSDALRDLGDRTNVPELKGFVLAMIQADIFGISIAKVLQVQAREMRIKRRQRAEEQAQKVPVKIVFPLILCIFPSLFIVLLGPAMITIYQNILKK